MYLVCVDLLLTNLFFQGLIYYSGNIIQFQEVYYYSAFSKELFC